MDKRLLLLALVAGAGVLGFLLASTFTSSGQVDLERQFARPKSPGTPEYREDFSVQEVKSFAKFPLYWVGEQFQELPLTKIIYSDSPQVWPAENYVVFLYGTCTPPRGGSCSRPLQIRVEPYCYAQPGMFAPEAKEGQAFKLRGADAQYISGALRMWMGSVAVKVSAYPQERMEEVAQALVTANTAATTAAGAAFPSLRADCSDFALEPYLGD